MSASSVRPLPRVAQVAHWAGCVLGAAAVVLFVYFAIGGGLPPLAALNSSFAALGMLLLGFLLMWWKDWVGGLVSLLGLAWFQAIEIAVNGHMAQGIFGWLVVPVILAFLA